MRCMQHAVSEVLGCDRCDFLEAVYALRKRYHVHVCWCHSRYIRAQRLATFMKRRAPTRLTDAHPRSYLALAARIATMRIRWLE